MGVLLLMAVILSALILVACGVWVGIVLTAEVIVPKRSAGRGHAAPGSNAFVADDAKDTRQGR